MDKQSVKKLAAPEPRVAEPKRSGRALLDSLRTASLSDIDAEIAAVQAEIDQRSAAIASLRAVRKFADVAQNGKPTRKPRSEWKRKVKAKIEAMADEAKPANGNSIGGDLLIGRLRTYLQHAGPSSTSAIAQGVGESADKVTACLRDNMQVFGLFPRLGGWGLRKDDE